MSNMFPKRASRACVRAYKCADSSVDCMARLKNTKLEANILHEQNENSDDEFIDFKPPQKKHKLAIHIYDLQQPVNCQKVKRSAVYGPEIDSILFEKVLERIQQGKPLNAEILNILLIRILKAKNVFEKYCIQQGHTFKKSWALRFCKRHNLNQAIAGTNQIFVHVEDDVTTMGDESTNLDYWEGSDSSSNSSSCEDDTCVSDEDFPSYVAGQNRENFDPNLSGMQHTLKKDFDLYILGRFDQIPINKLSALAEVAAQQLD